MEKGEEKVEETPIEKKTTREIKLLEQGFIPKKTKIGTKFKGKNRVIIVK